MRLFRRDLTRAVLLAACCQAALGCGGPRAVRGSEVEGLDDEAMSTGLDKRDLEKMLRENMSALDAAPAVQRWQKEDRPAVAVLPIRNETSEHVDSALQALISDVETMLINAGHVRVISHENQGALLDEIRKQYSDGFDHSKIAGWGKQVGARYFVTGKIFSSDERQDGERRVQYTLFMQILETETGDILFQHKSSVTKAMLR